MTLIPLSFPFHFPFHWSNSSSHPCTPGLLSQPLSGLPQAPVTPSQAIRQTSHEQKPLCSPLGWGGGLSLLIGVNEKPLPALLGPPESASSRFLVFSLDLPTCLLWFNMKSTYQKNLQHIPASAHTLPHIRTPFTSFPDTALNPSEAQVCAVTCWVRLCPPPLGFAPLWSSLFLTISGAAPGCSALLTVLPHVHLPN